jgi:hypothetical protein
VVVTNTSPEPITTTSLVDNIYGDLNGRGSCAIGVVLAANGGQYSCAFDGDFRGKAGDSQTDTVTVVAVNSHNISVTAKASATVTLTPVNVPPVVPPPVTIVVPPVTPAPVIQQVLVRTGTDALRQARVATVLLLLGLILVWASWRFGFGGGLELAPVPSGPRGGPRGPRGDGGLGDGSWFGRSPPRPPTTPLAGLGAVPPAPTRPRPELEPEAEAEAVTRAPALPPSAFTDVIDRSSRPWTATPVAPPPPAPPEVLLPTEVWAPPTRGLDAAALDAAAAEPIRTSPPGGSGSHHQRNRKFGGR